MAMESIVASASYVAASLNSADTLEPFPCAFFVQILGLIYKVDPKRNDVLLGSRLEVENRIWAKRGMKSHAAKLEIQRRIKLAEVTLLLALPCVFHARETQRRASGIIHWALE